MKQNPISEIQIEDLSWQARLYLTIAIMLMKQSRAGNHGRSRCLFGAVRLFWIIWPRHARAAMDRIKAAPVSRDQVSPTGIVYRSSEDPS